MTGRDKGSEGEDGSMLVRGDVRGWRRRRGHDCEGGERR